MQSQRYGKLPNPPGQVMVIVPVVVAPEPETTSTLPKATFVALMPHWAYAGDAVNAAPSMAAQKKIRREDVVVLRMSRSKPCDSQTGAVPPRAGPFYPSATSPQAPYDCTCGMDFRTSPSPRPYR